MSPHDPFAWASGRAALLPCGRVATIDLWALQARALDIWTRPAWMLWSGALESLFTIHDELVRNFLHLASIPWLHVTDVRAGSREEGHHVIEVERDGRVGIDLKFGSITFKEEAAGSFAVALVDVLVGAPTEAATRVQMEVRVAADPEHDSILGVTEACRAQIVATLRGAADKLDAMTARTLLFQEPPRSAAE